MTHGRKDGRQTRLGPERERIFRRQEGPEREREGTFRREETPRRRAVGLTLSDGDACDAERGANSHGLNTMLRVSVRSSGVVVVGSLSEY